MSRHQLHPLDTEDPSDAWPLAPTLRRGRFARWGRRGLLLLTLLVAVAAGGRLGLGWWGGAAADATVLRPAAASEAVPGKLAGDSGGAAPNTPSGSGDNDAREPSAPGSSSAAGGQAVSPSQRPASGGIAVHVVGQVHRPGMYRLPAGSLVDDAIRAAGGLTARAAPDSVNLAAPIAGGTQVRVLDRTKASAAGGLGEARSALPSAGETLTIDEASGVGGAGAGTAKTGGEATPAAPGMVDVNSAGLPELQQLPGIGPALAQRIIDFREANGRYARPQDLDAVKGIGPKLLAKLAPLVTCG